MSSVPCSGMDGKKEWASGRANTMLVRIVSSLLIRAMLVNKDEECFELIIKIMQQAYAMG